jgi:2-pyrone-4,6-dicarboxylate lactonase
MRPVRPPNPNPRAPSFELPPGACDTHLHVYGPFDRYPLVAERGYDPDPRSTLDDYLKTHRALGLERAVIVTGSGNGTNNRITYDALERMKGAFKGLALLDPAISDGELLKLKEGGFTGFRIKGNGRGGLSFDQSKKMLERTASFDWHVEFMSQSLDDVIDTVPFLNSLNVPYVFDHVAHAEPQHNRHDRQFDELLTILKNEEHAWLNLYSFYQLSKAGPPNYSDMVGVVQTIVEARPDHIVWGSNWPHGGVAVPTPNDGDLLDFLLTAAPDENIRNAILAANPAKLYGWQT